MQVSTRRRLDRVLLVVVALIVGAVAAVGALSGDSERIAYTEVHVAVHDPADESFVLLMEDLDQRGCKVPDGTWGIDPDAAAIALTELAELHVRFEDPARRAADLL